MLHRAAIAILPAVALAAGLRAQRPAAPPRWAEFEGIRIGAPLDEILALNGDCRPALSPSTNPIRVARWGFGYLLPELYGGWADSGVIAGALATGTTCRVTLLSGRAHAYVLAIDRLVVSSTINFFDTANAALPIDSVRELLRARWPHATSHYPRLDSWIDARYQAHLLAVPANRENTGPLAGQLIMVDLSACTAFVRRLRAATHGVAEAC